MCDRSVEAVSVLLEAARHKGPVKACCQGWASTPKCEDLAQFKVPGPGVPHLLLHAGGCYCCQ
jgi:hypothetical protein